MRKLASFLILPLLFFIIFFLVRIWITKEKSRKTIPLVVDGKPCACIALQADASKILEQAAAEISYYVEKRTGAVLSRCGDKTPQGFARVHVGRTDGLNLVSEGMTSDGFVIDFPDNETVAIVGATDQGTAFGVYDFLERFVDVRWLFPGPLGEDVPKSNNLEVECSTVREEPVFFSRQMSGFPNRIQKEWASHMRLLGHIKMHHNMNQIFPPEKYTRTHPEFFPIINGKRFLPSNNHTHGWQPCFSAKGLVEEAANNICRYFEKYPEQRIYSLGINDFVGICECKLCKAKESGRRNFVGYRDRSDPYFEWANAVAEKVLQRFPDKWFGCLAYDNILEAPRNNPVHPRIIPFMTYDRMKWIHKPTEKIGHQVTQAWAEKTKELGWYDYIYGSPYHVPRIYFHKMAEYYCFGADNGVSAFYAEACPNWGEGPKLYLAAKLMWNPYIDVDATLKDWYVRAVGEAAASDLAEYYRLWEDFWTRRILKADWFTPRGQFLHFWIPDYLELVCFEDVARSRNLLENVVRKVVTPAQKARAELLLRAFEYYEASALSYLGLIKKDRESGKNIEYYNMMHKKRKELVDSFEEDPVLVHPVRFDRKFSWCEVHDAFNVVR